MKNGAEIDTIGLVGLGLMGQGIATCLVAYGFNVVAYSRTASREQEAISHIRESLKKLVDRGTISENDMVEWEKRFRYVDAIEKMGESRFVIETVGESLELKYNIYKAIESTVGKEVVIATNTSGISISLLQEGIEHKERFIAMHWAEPAEITRYLEISPGPATAKFATETGRHIGERCGKHPTVLNFDLPGLISNRMMYAIIREAIHLVESGVADVETVDRSFRNDIGWWATLAGPFRWMDLTGLPIYADVMKGIFPELSNNKELPELMKERVATKTKHYHYTEEEEKDWDAMWTEFTHDVDALVKKYEKRANL
ncbi:MAG: 3-hydroxyacyl-CoA dehydrogenase family protein [Bacteroidota bacterium]